MAREIERKFLVRNQAWRLLPDGTPTPGTRLCQGYLSADPLCTVRVRLAGTRGFLTVKGPTSGAGRDEYEYEIPLADAEAMLENLVPGPRVEKVRYQVQHRGLIWEIDEFAGDNAGLTLAEVELESEDQAIELPDWAGPEVTGDPRYYNSNLARRPFANWKSASAD